MLYCRIRANPKPSHGEPRRVTHTQHVAILTITPEFTRHQQRPNPASLMYVVWLCLAFFHPHFTPARSTSSRTVVVPSASSVGLGIDSPKVRFTFRRCFRAFKRIVVWLFRQLYYILAFTLIGFSFIIGFLVIMAKESNWDFILCAYRPILSARILY